MCNVAKDGDTMPRRTAEAIGQGSQLHGQGMVGGGLEGQPGQGVLVVRIKASADQDQVWTKALGCWHHELIEGQQGGLMPGSHCMHMLAQHRAARGSDVCWLRLGDDSKACCPLLNAPGLMLVTAGLATVYLLVKPAML